MKKKTIIFSHHFPYVSRLVFTKNFQNIVGKTSLLKRDNFKA